MGSYRTLPAPRPSRRPACWAHSPRMWQSRGRGQQRPQQFIPSVTEANSMSEVSSSKSLAVANGILWSSFQHPSCFQVVYVESSMVRLLILVHLLQNKRKQHLIARACCLGCRQHRTEPNRLITAVLLRLQRCTAVLPLSQQEPAAHRGSPCDEPSHV